MARNKHISNEIAEEQKERQGEMKLPKNEV